LRTTLLNRRSGFALLVIAGLFSVIDLNAQTLEHRQPAKASVDENKMTKASEMPTLRAGTSLQVEILRHYPMKAGEAIEGRLVYPLYANGKLVVPQNTVVDGTVASLEPDSKTRWHGRLRGDFTPFHTAKVEFHQLELPGGPMRIATNGAMTGATVLRLSAPGATPKRSLLGREWLQAKTTLHDRIAFFTAPGKRDRALQILYHQLPYHPERIDAHTAWSFELAAPLTFSDQQTVALPASAKTSSVVGRPETWSVHAVLRDGVTSATAKPGDPVQALVIEPVFDNNKELVVPQDSMLIGKVTTAKAARSLGRNGKLRFTFQQVRFPPGSHVATSDRTVEGALAGATPEGSQALSLDAEGTITPKSQSSVIAPLFLTILAGRALDSDGNLTAGTGVASNGFGLVGRVVGIAAGNRDLAAGLGYYAAALSFYENFMRKGHDVVFPKDTRIEIETTPLRGPTIEPARQ
jgi:hypothetical protein